MFSKQNSYKAGLLSRRYTTYSHSNYQHTYKYDNKDHLENIYLPLYKRTGIGTILYAKRYDKHYMSDKHNIIFFNSGYYFDRTTSQYSTVTKYKSIFSKFITSMIENKIISHPSFLEDYLMQKILFHPSIYDKRMLYLLLELKYHSIVFTTLIKPGQSYMEEIGEILGIENLSNYKVVNFLQFIVPISKNYNRYKSEIKIQTKYLIGNLVCIHTQVRIFETDRLMKSKIMNLFSVMYNDVLRSIREKMRTDNFGIYINNVYEGYYNKL